MTEEKEAVLQERRRAVLDEQRNVTSRISDTCRYIGFGLLVVFYASRFGEPESASLQETYGRALYIIGLTGGLTIVFDYFQYVFGASAVQTALSRNDYMYDDHSIAYRGRRACFVLKQWSAGIGSLVLALAIGVRALL
jgi:hypothetical protein